MKKRTYAVRYTAGKPVARFFSEEKDVINSEALTSTTLCTGDSLRLMVWNIYKQQRDNWLQVLEQHAKELDLLLLQEAQATPELIHFATQHYLVSDQVPAVSVHQHPSGVMTLSRAHPLFSCPFREKEPILRIAKSALVAVYPLTAITRLMVVNIHAVNFSGVQTYSRQLDPIREIIHQHEGPVILAGDFNAWNRQRIVQLYLFAENLHLEEVCFNHDKRKRAFGKPLDFVFYRGFKLVSAEVPETTASDHNPLLVELLLLPQEEK